MHKVHVIFSPCHVLVPITPAARESRWSLCAFHRLSNHHTDKFLLSRSIAHQPFDLYSPLVALSFFKATRDGLEGARALTLDLVLTQLVVVMARAAAKVAAVHPLTVAAVAASRLAARGLAVVQVDAARLLCLSASSPN